MANFTGTNSNNRIVGSNSPDVIDGRGGNDLIFGYGNGSGVGGAAPPVDPAGGGALDHDSLLGGSGNDTIHAGGGNDRLDGGSGRDRLNGGDGNDTVTGGTSNDTMDGGAGSDDYRVSGFGHGFDRYQDSSGVSDHDRIVAAANGTRIGLASGFGPASGIEEITGDGHFLVFVGGGSGADKLDFSNTVLTDIAGIDAGGGNDTVTGSAGADAILGGSGNDSLAGGDGDDVLVGTFGNDKIGGGDGTDTAVFLGKAADYQITTVDGVTTVKDLRPTRNGNDGTDILTDVERLQFIDQVIVLDSNATPATPVDNDPADNEVAENAAVGAAVGITAFADDPDAGDTGTYSLTDDAGGLFAIDANTGVVTVAGTLDAETAASHSITVEASDGTNKSSQSFTIAVTDVNEFAPTAPVDNDAADNEVAENAAIGAAVGITALSTDADLTGAVTYSLTDNAGGLFAIEANTGVVAVAGTLDAETAPSHSITVEASDGTNKSSQSLTIDVLDVNEGGPSTPIDNDGADNEVAENAAVGTAVGITAFADDPDPGDTVTYSLTDDAGGLFAIDANTGIVTVAGTLDAETVASHSITVEGSGGTNKSSQSFTIAVTDVNEFAPTAPVDDDAAANEVAEDATVGTAVGITALSTDTDLTGAVTYSLTDDAGGLFAIDANSGVVTVAGTLDAETAASHSITVEASDGINKSSQSFTIDITDVNEFAPTPPADNDAADNEVAEDATVGAAVGITALSTDADLTGAVTYSLTDHAGGLFAIDANTGIVTLAGTLDAEAAASHSVTVEASDGTNKSSTSFTISVLGVNDGGPSTPVDNDGADNKVAENAALGAAVGITAFATDPDAGDTVAYSLTDDAGGLFAIDDNTGVVTVAGTLDAETAASHSITVEASDGTNKSSQSFTIDVTDVNEFAPTAPADDDDADNEVAENAAVGAAVGITALSTDGDLTGAVTYSLTDDAGGLFAIDANAGIVTVAGSLDAETTTSHNITVLASDGVDSSLRSFTINVMDVDEFGMALDLDANNSFQSVIDPAGTGDTTGFEAVFVSGTPPIPVVDVDVTVGDADISGSASDVVRATIELVDPPDAGETISIDSAALAAIAGGAISATTLTPTTIVLESAAGAATAADYEAAVRLVRYANTSATPTLGERTVEITVNDGAGDSNTAVATIAIETTGSVIDAVGPPVGASELTGTFGNDIFFFQGAMEAVRATFVNPYSGDIVFLDGDWNVNTASYDGLAGKDTLFMTNVGDFVHIGTPASGQIVSSVETYFSGDGADVIDLASTSFVLGNIQIDGGAANDILWANAGDDTLSGREGNDTIDGGLGDDTLNGGLNSSLIVSGDDRLRGGRGNDLLRGEDGNDVLIGDEGSDTLMGGSGTDSFQGGADDDVIALDSPLFADIDGGSGTDTVRLDGAGQTFDLTAIGQDEIQGIERIELTGGNNTMVLSVQDVLDLSDSSNELLVTGSTGDTVNRGAGWTTGATTVVGAETYQIYTAGEATLLVDTDITPAV